MLISRSCAWPLGARLSTMILNGRGRSDAGNVDLIHNKRKEGKCQAGKYDDGECDVKSNVEGVGPVGVVVGFGFGYDATEGRCLEFLFGGFPIFHLFVE